MELPGSSAFRSGLLELGGVFYTQIYGIYMVNSVYHALLFTGAWFWSEENGFLLVKWHGRWAPAASLARSTGIQSRAEPVQSKPPEPGTAGRWVLSQDLRSTDLVLPANVVIVLTDSSDKARGCPASGLQPAHKASAFWHNFFQQNALITSRNNNICFHFIVKK